LYANQHSGLLNPALAIAFWLLWLLLSATSHAHSPTQYLVDELNPTGWPQVLEELTSAGGGLAAVTRTYTWGHALLAQDRLAGTD
jgi:hypothetical protein